jgi:phosphate transport system protein
MVRDTFGGQLSKLDQEVTRMADLARRMLHGGLEALESMDRQKAAEVISKTDELAGFDEAIETAALNILMLQAPVARDLRRIGAVLKLITYLNRVGRYGYDIARVVEHMPANMPSLNLVSQRQMAANVARMLDLVLESFRTSKAPDVQALMKLEDDVDAQRHAIQREALTYMMADARNIEPYANIMMVARYLERCGDNIVKMAEKLHYAATGERVLLK